jgi:antitoxin (DNA-binding transcriptional repressor) of toxin-antitoxin stability system
VFERESRDDMRDLDVLAGRLCAPGTVPEDVDDGTLRSLVSVASCRFAAWSQEQRLRQYRTKAAASAADGADSFVQLEEYGLKATQFLRANEELVITRYGKPIARLVPETEESISDLIAQMSQIFKEAGITKKQALQALEDARREMYGPRRRTAPSRRRAAA